MPHLEPISCSLIVIGLGWTFAEVRRFFFHRAEFFNEAVDDYQDGSPISLVCGVAFLFVGALLAFHAFELGAPILSRSSPYVVAGPEARHFLIVFGSGLVVWAVLSAASTRFLPPPLFSEPVAALLCRVVRGGLLLLLGGAVLLAYRRIGDNWRADGFAIFCAVLAFLAIYTGQLWNRIHIGENPIPPVTCADRPFPFVAWVVVFIGLAYFFFVV